MPLMTAEQIKAEIAALDAAIERPRDPSYVAALQLRQEKQRREMLQAALQNLTKTEKEN